MITSLVVQRKRGKAVYVGDDIKITFLDYSRGDGVLQVEVPVGMPILLSTTCRKDLCSITECYRYSIIQGRKGTVFHIDDDIKVTFLRYEKGSASIRIEAPAEVKILREELRNGCKPITDTTALQDRSLSGKRWEDNGPLSIS